MRNHADTTPCATVHCVNRWQIVTEHEEFTTHLELLLIGEKATGLHQVLSTELLHTAGVQGFILIWLIQIDESPVFDGHDIRIGCT